MSQKNAPPFCDYNFIKSTDIQSYLTAGKSVKCPTKRCIALPATPKMCCCTTSRNLNVQNCCIYLLIKLCFNKRQLPNQTHGCNFITSQPIIRISQMFCESAAYLLDSEPDCKPGQHFLQCLHFVVSHYLWVCWLGRCLWTFQQPVNATFYPPFVWKFIHSLTSSLYIPLTDKNSL